MWGWLSPSGYTDKQELFLPEWFEELLWKVLIEMRRSSHIPTLDKLQITESILKMIDNADQDQLFDIDQRINDFTKDAESYRATGWFFKAIWDSIWYRRAHLESDEHRDTQEQTKKIRDIVDTLKNK